MWDVKPIPFGWDQIASEGYAAYGVSTGNKNFRGDPMPVWKDLPEPIRVAWQEAARRVVLAHWEVTVREIASRTEHPETN
jgi:hypothetical protein